MRKTMAIFGAVLGIMLAWIGIALSQDIVLRLDAETEVPNPIPVANMIWPSFRSSPGAEVTIEGIGYIIFMSLVLLIAVLMVAVGFMFYFIPGLRGGMSVFLSFAIFLIAFMMICFIVGLKIAEAFG